ncbi:unnamed protein product [Rhizoctonia solani]|uniref:Uncharacterized protein n=1 Tax=Rhizoctonia solani TaxID=456999 RepID=A0A8H3C3Q6_9AGAM|nr:unnamed protein product [Rhizoctonia solani]
MYEAPRHCNRNRIESGTPLIPCDANSKSTEHNNETIDIIENNDDYVPHLDASTYGVFLDQFPQGQLAYHIIPARNAMIGESNSLTEVGMGEPWPDSWLTNNEDIAVPLRWSSSSTASSWQESFPDSLGESNSLNSLIDSDPMLVFSPRLLDTNGSAASLPTAGHFVNAVLSQRIPCSDDWGSYGTNNSAEMATTSHEFNEASSQMTSAQASLLQALLSLGGPLAENSSPQSSPTIQLIPGPTGSQYRSTKPAENRVQGTFDENEDPELIQTIICGQLVLDRNLESNSLPFALHSYALWMQRTLFDPLRAASRTRNYVIRHFAESAQSRSRTILIANIFRSIATNPIFDLSYLPKLSALRTTIHTSLKAASNRTTNPSREIQNRESIRALEQTLEMFSASRYEPLYICLQLMREAAPVFRCACPEPMNQLVHLPSILLHPNANMRHYPVMDVYFSIVTGLPTNLTYDTSLRSPVDTSVLYIDNHLGLSWLYGQPDSITLILARTNSLYQEFGASVNSNIIEEIEKDIQRFKAVSGSSPDPSLLVMRLVVQECWRQVAYIYLYMTLCDTDALDARVRTAQQRLMKLINDTKPAPALDMHLAPCLGIAGVVTCQPSEREAMLLRLQGLPECSRPESCFSSCIRILEELWRQTDSEGRPAKWLDFRLATLRVLGIP